MCNSLKFILGFTHFCHLFFPVPLCPEDSTRMYPSLLLKYVAQPFSPSLPNFTSDIVDLCLLHDLVTICSQLIWRTFLKHESLNFEGETLELGWLSEPRGTNEMVIRFTFHVIIRITTILILIIIFWVIEHKFHIITFPGKSLISVIAWIFSSSWKSQQICKYSQVITTSICLDLPTSEFYFQISFACILSTWSKLVVQTQKPASCSQRVK